MATIRMVDLVGRVLGGRYRLNAPIAAGASAQVFLADDTSLRRQVAVKVLHPALAGDEAFLRRFRAEARAAAALNHPNVMVVYDWGQDDDNGPFLVCEYLGGGSLRSLLDRGRRLTPAQARLVALEAARGLDYAHRRGLVHRDIKPANLLFGEDGRLRIADFGLARALAEAAWTEPLGSVLGTARYASPEQARGQSVDGKSDIYSLAIVLVESVTGQAPFAADTTVATLMARLDTPLVAPEELGPLAPIVERAGHPDHGHRPDAAALATALEVAGPRFSSALPLPMARLAQDDDPVVVAHPDPTALGRRPEVDKTRPEAPKKPRRQRRAKAADPMVLAAGRRRRRWPIVALAVLVLGGLLGAGVWALLARPGAPSHPVPDLVRLVEPEATARLTALKLKVRREEQFFDATYPTQVMAQRPPPGVERKEGDTVTLVISKGPPPVAVPDLGARSQDDATAALEAGGLTVGNVEGRNDEQAPEGQVLDWAHKGETVPKGSPVDLVVSSGPAPRRIPDGLAGGSYEDAAAALEEIGLVPVRQDDFSDTVPPGQVIGTEPGFANLARRGSRVKVSVSKGPDLVAVPAVVNRTVPEATLLLKQAGLNVTNVFGPPDKAVFSTNPAGAAQVKRGSGVDLYTR